MAENSTPSKLNVTRLVLVPALITLAVTLLRLIGELQHWPSVLFSRAEGGGAAIVGISWLPIIFGPYFAVKLIDQGRGPSSFAKTIGFALLGFVVLMLGAGHPALPRPSASRFSGSWSSCWVRVWRLRPILLFQGISRWAFS
jgi:hypothetical protein